MTDHELEILLDDIESDRAERKESLADSQKIRQAICAFANDLPNHRQPGILFIGASNDGRPASWRSRNNLPTPWPTCARPGTSRSTGKVSVTAMIRCGTKVTP
jgi:hypothetical protein